MDEDFIVRLAQADIYLPKYAGPLNLLSEHLRNIIFPLFNQPKNSFIGGVLL